MKPSLLILFFFTILLTNKIHTTNKKSPQNQKKKIIKPKIFQQTLEDLEAYEAGWRYGFTESPYLKNYQICKKEDIPEKNPKIKWGLLFYFKTLNIGDDFQTYAAMNYLPKNYTTVDPVDRENLLMEKRNLTVLFNGWFMHIPEYWPPPENINPIFIGFHIAAPEIVTEKYKEFYKKYEPIGCRDYGTVELLRKIGVKAYFSGCLTLTLKNKYNYRTNDVYVADAKNWPPSSKTPNPLMKLIPKHILQKAKYTSQGYTLPHHDFEFRINNITEAFLKKYATAKLVITSRLHVALPCLAYRTPVIFLHPNLDDDIRFKGFLEYLYAYGSVNDKPDIDWDNLKPKKDISGLVDKIKKDLAARLEGLI